MVGSECELKMNVRNLGYPLPIQIGAKNTFFRPVRNLTAILTAYNFGKTWYRQSGKCVDNYERSLINISKCRELWPTNGFKLDRHFYPPSLPGFVDGHQLTELNQTEGRKWRWCMPNKAPPHSECKWNHQNWVAGVPGPKTHFASGGRQWQYIVNCHIFYLIMIWLRRITPLCR